MPKRLEKKDRTPAKKQTETLPQYSAIIHLISMTATLALEKLTTPAAKALTPKQKTHLPDEKDDQLSIHGTKGFPGDDIFHRKG